jgi:hypothetical protein
MDVPVNRHSFALFPTLDRGYIAVEIRRDFLPGVQTIFRLH